MMLTARSPVVIVDRADRHIRHVAYGGGEDEGIGHFPTVVPEPLHAS